MTTTGNDAYDSWARAEAGIANLLSYLGYDPASEALGETPARVVAAYAEMTAGTGLDPTRHLKRTFPAEGTDHDEVIAVAGIDYVAVCEHHLLPFAGTASVGYKPSPGAPVVGLSKLARLVEEYAQRLTMQERITRQVTDALDDQLETEGAACVLRSHHMCMGIRGVRKPSAEMVTSSMTGIFRTNPSARAEFLQLTR